MYNNNRTNHNVKAKPTINHRHNQRSLSRASHYSRASHVSRGHKKQPARKFQRTNISLPRIAPPRPPPPPPSIIQQQHRQRQQHEEQLLQHKRRQLQFLEQQPMMELDKQKQKEQLMRARQE
eukprot:UN32187